MHYSKALTVTASTTAGDTDTLTFKVVPQVVTRVRVYFPAGCHGLVRVAIFNGEHQFAPSDPGEYFRGEDGAIDYQAYYDMRKGPNNITIKAYNEDTAFDHEVLINITILPFAIASPYKIIEGLVNAFKTLIGME